MRFEKTSGFSGASHGQGLSGRNYSFIVVRFVWISGGFKFEAQRALKIDGTPLKVF